MILADGHGCRIECDSCGAVGEGIDARNPRSGTLTAAFLPMGWAFDVVEGEHVHRCGTCVAAAVEPFADRREAFEARLEQLGTALTVDISASLGVPIALGRRWAGEWRNRQFSVADRGRHQRGKK